MTVQQALAIITQVCAQHVGTLKDHEIVQQALAVIEELVEPKMETQVRQQPQEERAPHGHA